MATKSPARSIAKSLDIAHDVLCELTEETQALRVLSQLGDHALEHGDDYRTDLLLSLNRVMGPHLQAIEQQLTRLDEAILALRKAA